MPIFTAAYVNEADPELSRFSERIEWLHLGQVKRLIRFFKKNEVSRTVMMDAVDKTGLFSDVKPDMKAIAIITGMRHTHDDAIETMGQYNVRSLAIEAERTIVFDRSEMIRLANEKGIAIICQ